MDKTDLTASLLQRLHAVGDALVPALALLRQPGVQIGAIIEVNAVEKRARIQVGGRTKSSKRILCDKGLKGCGIGPAGREIKELHTVTINREAAR